MPSDRIGYGYGTYSDADFGVEGLSKTGSATISATSTFAANGGKSEVGSAVLTASSVISANATAIIVGTPSEISGSSAVADVSADRIKDGSASITTDSGNLYGYGAYGVGDYGKTTVFAIRVRTSSGSADAVAALTSSAERIQQPSAQIDAVASLAADSDTIVNGQAVLNGAAGIEVAYIRIRNTAMTVSAAGDLDANGREKWEPIAETPEIWTRID